MTDTGTFAPPAASSAAGPYDFLFFCLVLLTVILCAGIACFILYFAVKYRRKRIDDFGQHVGDHTTLEIIWTAIPLAICLVIFGWAAHLYSGMIEPPTDAMIVQVVGKQWMWKLQHPTGRKEINELHLPLGRPIKLVMTSEDVIHSFFIPAFRIKQDVLPGRYTQEWFTPTRLGEYDMLCSEYCGTSHSGHCDDAC
jgi:cytochrome c oxidase subunit 2